MGGTKFDQGKPRMGLVEPEFIAGMARVLDFGEKKYGAQNWKKGLERGRVIDAALRHLAAFQSGEEVDGETGESHCLHAACCLMFLHYYGQKAQASSVRDVQERIKKWADSIYPDRTAHSALVKLVLEEIPELLGGGLDRPEEYADTLILLFDIAQMKGIDVLQAVNDKMDINEKRTWEINKETGLMRHV